METLTDRFIKIVDYLIENHVVKSNAAFCREINMNPSQLSDARRGLREIPSKYIDAIVEEYNASKEYLQKGIEPLWNVYQGSVKKDSQNDHHSSQKERKDITNAKDIAEIQYPLEPSEESPFMDLGDGKYLMFVPLIQEPAYAGYLGGFADPEWVEERPKHTIIVDRHHRGLYRAFEVVGDSMTDGTDESIMDGSIVVGRFLQRHHWATQLHTHKYSDWVIVHKTRGIVVKRIFHKNIKDGVITIKSLNPDKDTFPDEDFSLDDIQELYNVVQYSKTARRR